MSPLPGLLSPALSWAQHKSVTSYATRTPGPQGQVCSSPVTHRPPCSSFASDAARSGARTSMSLLLPPCCGAPGDWQGTGSPSLWGQKSTIPVLRAPCSETCWVTWEQVVSCLGLGPPCKMIILLFWAPCAQVGWLCSPTSGKQKGRILVFIFRALAWANKREG